MMQQVEKILNDPENYALLTTQGEVKEVVIGVPHHAPLGVPTLPSKEHPYSDENAGVIGYEVARLLKCRSIIACNSPIDPNKHEDSDYCKTILDWKPKFLIEIHGHGGKSAKFDIEISSGSKTRNFWSKEMAERLRAKLFTQSQFQGYTLSGDIDQIYFKAKKSYTITMDVWVPFHIELPWSIRKSEEKSTLICGHLAETIRELLLSYDELQNSI
ncbi:MAG: hypothetical protein PVJ21_19705 [Anaerolineales bacterium]|jgi:hypothetical protein